MGQGSKKSDLELGKWTLPVIYTMQVIDSPEQVILRNLIQSASVNKNSVERAMHMIIGSGALIYAFLELEKHKKIATNYIEKYITRNTAGELIELLSLIGSFDRVRNTQ